jgi:hypothetical protein
MNTVTISATVLLILIILACYALSALQQREFNKRFPPISDAEFVARCTPGIKPEVALKVRRIVADNLGVNYDQIYPCTRFVDDLDAA